MNAEPSGISASARMLVRPHPIGLDNTSPVESFMSWCTRLAWANGFRTMHHLLSSEGISWAASSDARSDLMLKLLRLAGLDESVLRVLSLEDLLRFLGSRGNGGSGSIWVLSRSDFSKGVPHQVCPHCTAEQAIPYWTKSSRMSYTTQCTIHSVVLLSHCPSCGDPLALCKTRAVGLTQCAKCRLDLRSVRRSKLLPAERVPQHWSSSSAVTPHPCVSGSIKKWSLWSGIRTILAISCDRDIASKLLRLSFVRDHHCLFEAVACTPQLPFDQHASERRHRMLVFAKWLLEDWEERILRIQSDFDIGNSFCTHDITGPPNWTREFFRHRELQLPAAERYAFSLVRAA